MAKNIKTVAVTGGAGFIGSEFVRQAVGRGYTVTVIDKLTYAGDLERLKEVKGKIGFYKTDIADEKRILAALKHIRPDVVVNFAAETHVDRSILDAASSINTNVAGTQSLIEACRQLKVARFVHLSTDEVYGDITNGQFHETTPLNPSSPYSAGKAAADMIIKAYQRTYRFPVIIVRPCNNYGPWQYPEKFMPVIIYKALKNQKVPVYGQGLNVREWLYVTDCADAVLAIMEKGREGEIYNIGSNNEQRNIDVVKKVLSALNKPETLIEFVQDRPGHDFRYSLNFQKIQKELGWRPRVNFDDGIRQTIDNCRAQMPWMEKKAAYLQGYWKKVYKRSVAGRRQ